MIQLVLTSALLAAVSAFPQQYFAPAELSISIQPPPLQQQQFQPYPQQQVFQRQQVQQVPQQNYAHRAVVANAQREAQLPPHLLNPFYKNQRIASALAKESWFTPGENLVVDREAEKIPRQRIYSVLKNAGFINRRR
ncbi:uncharacterized protein LOC128992484 [Macrosteles quadrilineatus]|uniref:uncharacterized protein LOC128992484 n=1 Tax=Macrosteles quadrilineatus TaxID=74068 RepID=UPI0023E20294|nr:uncharacterized protein LOC128992484 [Macrosteles quadrilineatus]XP_054272050.1 uncharacterized protein LOC128992484 [Macrosteles quadrilineatus]